MAVGRHPKQYNVHPKLHVVCSAFRRCCMDVNILYTPHCTVPARSDKCLHPGEASQTERLNMRRPKDGADVRQNAQETVMWRDTCSRCIMGLFRPRQLMVTQRTVG